MRQPSNGNHSYGHHGYDAREDYERGLNKRNYSFGGHNTWGSQELSLAGFNGLIGLILLYGFGVNVILVSCCSQYFANINPIVLVIGYLVLSIIGIIMSRKSDDPFISFIGYNLVVIPIGVVLSVCLAGQTSVSILNACAVTAGVTVIMIIAGTLKPDFFLSLGRALGIALLAVIIVEVVLMLFGVVMPTIWDFLVALIFCGYIGYDWADAQSRPHTADGAVDACVGLYLDVVNLFLRILSIMGSRDND